MDGIDQIREAAQQKARKDKSQNSALFLVALAIPLLGAGVGLIARVQSDAPANMASIHQADTNADIAAELERARNHPTVKRQIEMAKNPPQDAIALEMRKYNRVQNILKKCMRANPANKTYADLLKRYREKNDKAHDLLNAKLMAETNKEVERFSDFQGKIKEGNQASNMFEIMKFTQGGGAARYAGTMMRSMAAMDGGPIEATPELCSKTVTDLSLGKYTINPNINAG